MLLTLLAVRFLLTFQTYDGATDSHSQGPLIIALHFLLTKQVRIDSALCLYAACTPTAAAPMVVIVLYAM